MRRLCATVKCARNKQITAKDLMMGRTIKVAAAQTGPVLVEDMRPGIEVACRMVKDAASQGADIICFSELFLTPFFPNQLRQDYEHFFLELPSPVTAPLVEAARRQNIALILPFGEKAGQYYYNSAAVFDRAGRHLGTYRKTHIPAILPSSAKGGTGSYEKFYFTPGDSLPIFELEGVRFGIQICYDRKFPEGSRALAVQAAEIIFMPICAATYGENVLRGDTWELPLRCRAYERRFCRRGQSLRQRERAPSYRQEHDRQSRWRSRDGGCGRR
jgi:predicted amidohydrolase